MCTFVRKLETTAELAKHLVEPPWEGSGISKAEYLKNLTHDLEHLAGSLRGHVEFKGLGGGTPLQRVRDAARLVRWVIYRKFARELETLVTQHKLQAQLDGRRDLQRRLGQSVTGRLDT